MKITRQQSIQAQDFLKAPDEVLITAAENGLFLKHSLSFKDKAFKESDFEKRPYIIRHPTEKDLDTLLKVEKDCWPKHLQASPEMISQRISKYPAGNCVIEIEGRIIGVIYSQRINSIKDISKINIENALSIHSNYGKIVQFLSISILPEAKYFGPGAQLLEYMLQYSALKSNVDYIVALSLCKNYSKNSYIPMEEYIKKRNSQNELIDEILRFHESHGGKITGLVPGYRPKDIDNMSNGVLVEYDIKNFKNKQKNLENIDIKSEDIKTIIEECICAVLPKGSQYDPEYSLMDMGLDSVHIIGLRSLLKQRTGFEPNSTFFFYYTRPESIIQFFEKKHKSSAKYSNDNLNKELEIQESNHSTIIKIEPVAIVGMSCRFPGANNSDEFWSILKNGISTTSKVPKNRWNYHQYIDDHTDDNPLQASQFGGFLTDVDLFDPAFFNIMPREANQMDPQQRILLEQSWRGFENAGIDPLSLKGSQTGVFVGIYTHDYENLNTRHINTKDLDIYYATGNSNSIAAGRLSYFYGIHGPSFSVETACSSSLVAVHQACQSLRCNECNLALAAGVNLILSPEYNIVFSRSGMLSKNGLCKTFDAKADGYVRSEGCGVVVLKTLSKAIADNDNILAVIKGSAVNQDGSSNGITAPNGFAQEQVINQALNISNINSENVSYVEAHGTGTLLGDPVEIKAINDTYGKNRSENKPLTVGSVKTNIGHTESAAGIASLIKVILAMKYNYIPKHLHFNTLNPYIKTDNSSIQIPTKGMEWTNDKDQLIAGISSFGFSGTNAHVIVEKYTGQTAKKAALPAKPFNRQRYWIEPDKVLEDVQVNREQDIYRFIYEMQWQPDTRDKKGNSDSSDPVSGSEKWLIFVDNNIGDALCLLLEKQGHQCIKVHQSNSFNQPAYDHYQINPLEKDDYEQLLDDVLDNKKLNGIVFLWGIDYENKDISHIGHESKICASISYLIQALNELPDQQFDYKLWLITRETQQVENNSIQLSSSSIWGLGRIIKLEHPRLNCTLIDIENNTTDQKHALQIFNEITHPDKENQIAYRENIRYVARLKKYAHTTKDLKAFRLVTSEPGTLDNLMLKPVKRPEIKPDEVEIRVLAAGLNYKDVLKSLGMVEQNLMASSDSEILFGLECAGIIESVGSNVSDFKIGDKVIALHAPGCFSRFITVKADLLVLKPDNLSFAEAASLPIVFLTAWNSLVRLANIKEGDRVLVHSAAGGVGHAAIQIIKSRKAKAYVTASAGKFDYLQSLGLKKIMNSRTLDFADDIKKDPGEIDIVLNSLNGEYIPKSLDLLSNGGTFVEIGKIGIWSHEQVKKRRPDISYHFFDLEDVAQEDPELVRSMFKDILNEIANGTLKITPIKAFPVSEISNAFQYMARSKHMGKIAITFPENETKDQLSLKNSYLTGSYLITGGFGALGLEVANWLMNKYCRNIVLCGRSEPSPEASQVINKMKDNGVNIISFFGDIADKNYVNQTIDKVKNSLPPLKGIIHAAGITEDAVINRQNYDHFKNVMLPKIEGAWNLHMATKDLSLDFFVCFSSFVSIIGWPGQGNYAAANAFMDTLVYYRKQSGLPATTINWGPWANIGMAARLGKNLRDKFDAKGIVSLDSDTALSVMEKILNKGISQSIVVNLDWKKYKSDLPFFESIKVKTEKSDNKTEKSNNEKKKPFINQLTSALPGDAKKMLISYIRSKLAVILGIKNPEQIHLRERLFEAGMDSLMAIELKNQLESDLGYSFRNSLLFDYPTPESLVEYLQDQAIFPETKEIKEDISFEGDDIDVDSLLSEIDGMSEDEIENQLMSMN